MIIETRAYARAGLLGNPSDGFFGKTIAISVRNFGASVTLYPSPELHIEPQPQDTNVFRSLYHLRELKFDKLKIDRSYVESMRLSSERAKLVDAIIALGSSLGLLTTAEGIESGTSVDWLAGQGCTYGQGYLFGRPMNKATTDGLLTQWSDDEGRIVIAPSLSETSELAERELVALAPPPALRQAAA